MRPLPKIRKKRRPDGSTYYTLRVRGSDKYLGTHEGGARRKASALLKTHYASTPPPSRPEFVAEAIELWCTDHPSYPYPVVTRTYLQWAGHMALDELDSRHLVAFLRHLQAGWTYQARGRKGNPSDVRTGHYSAWSLRRRIGFARRVLKWAHEEGWIKLVPRMPDLPSPVRVPRDVDPVRLRAAFQTLPRRVALLLRFMAETGCRPSEATQLKWSDIHLDRGVAVLVDHKTAGATRSAKSLVLTDGAKALLAACPKIQDCPWIFPSRLKRPYTISGIRSILRNHKVPITPYQLRHTFAQWLADAGVGVDDIAGFLGHKDSRTARFYVDIRAERLRKVASRLGGSLTDMPVNDPDSGQSACAP